MNSSITFNDIGLFNSAVTALELDSVPEYDVEDSTLTVFADDIDAIIDVLHDNEIYSFSCHREEGEEYDQFRTDGEADADALASAGWGSDEDYQTDSHSESYGCLGDEY